jgi:hypothetical protein
VPVNCPTAALAYTAATHAYSCNQAPSFTGNVTLGDAATDTVTVNGYMGVGGAGTAGRGVYVTSAALTGTQQHGVSSAPTGSSAATVLIAGYHAAPTTAAASFTVTDLIDFWATNATKGAGSTVTNHYGLYVENISQGGTLNVGVASAVSSGTGKWNIYASGTAANYFAGQVLIGTTAAKTPPTTNIPPRVALEHAATFPALSIYAYKNGTTAGGTVVLGHSKSDVLGTLTETVANDGLGYIGFEGVTSASTFGIGGYIQASQEAAAGATYIPTRLQFFTSEGTALPTERMRINSAGNVGINVATFGTNAAGVLALKNGTAPTTAPADTLQIYASDVSAGNSALSWFQEAAVSAAVATASTNKIPVIVNGTVYYLLATTVP